MQHSPFALKLSTRPNPIPFKVQRRVSWRMALLWSRLLAAQEFLVPASPDRFHGAGNEMARSHVTLLSLH
ncbi:hypothetical protein FPOAC1_000609 [Fusarium poae]|uniref:hypothetical protein n=1 Tax=Fusarium poae TaxID=36050 RepID=UPI001CE98C00|nr:hypothetical protein FPOAC1_000609 [Fusarium poae]KAG8674638.1 hypothetical protein FPOAC1_000609 [Fusarium poae]